MNSHTLSPKQIEQLFEGARKQALYDIRENGGMDSKSYGEYLEYMSKRHGFDRELVVRLLDEYAKEFDRLHRNRGYRSNSGRFI